MPAERSVRRDASRPASGHIARPRRPDVRRLQAGRGGGELGATWDVRFPCSEHGEVGTDPAATVNGAVRELRSTVVRHCHTLGGTLRRKRGARKACRIPEMPRQRRARTS